eukprot:GILI01005135.1.p1 GENE.GILI01005135.1~~GILI01005135.1.p1  ORF type:complete len:1107 (-),score=210.86 GILI01005135.1:39-3110(-)
MSNRQSEEDLVATAWAVAASLATPVPEALQVDGVSVPNPSDLFEASPSFSGHFASIEEMCASFVQSGLHQPHGPRRGAGGPPRAAAYSPIVTPSYDKLRSFPHSPAQATPTEPSLSPLLIDEPHPHHHVPPNNDGGALVEDKVLVRLLRSSIVAITTALFEVEDVTDIDVVCLSHNRKTTTTTSSVVRTVAAHVTAEKVTEAIAILATTAIHIPTQPAIVSITTIRAAIHKLPVLFSTCEHFVTGLIAVLCRVCVLADSAPVVVNAAMIALCEIIEYPEVKLPSLAVLRLLLGPTGLLEIPIATGDLSPLISAASSPLPPLSPVGHLVAATSRNAITSPFLVRLLVAHHAYCIRVGCPRSSLGMQHSIGAASILLSVETSLALKSISALPLSIPMCGGEPLSPTFWDSVVPEGESKDDGPNAVLLSYRATMAGRPKMDATLLSTSMENGALCFAADPTAIDTIVTARESEYYRQLACLIDTHPMLSDPSRLVPSAKQPLMVPTSAIRPLPLVLAEVAEQQASTSASASAADQLAVALSQPRLTITFLRPYLLRARGLSAVVGAIAPVLATIDRPNAGPILQRTWPLLEIANQQQCEKALVRLSESVKGSEVVGVPKRSPPTVNGVDTAALLTNTSSSLFETLSNCLFRKLYEQLFAADPSIWAADQPFFTKLGGLQQAAIDQGGICRDTLSLIGVEIMTRHSAGSFMMNPLFVRCNEEATLVMPAPINNSDPTHRPMLVFFGRVLAHFLITDDVLPADLPLFFWYLLLYKVVRPDLLDQVCPEALAMASPATLESYSDILEDFEDTFPNLKARYRQLMKQRDEEIAKEEAEAALGLEIPSSSDQSDDRAPITAQQPSPLSISPYAPVYLQLSQECISQLADNYTAPVAAIREGMGQVLGGEKRLQSLFVKDVANRSCGISAISAADMRSVITHSMLAPTANAFWYAVDQMSNDQRGQLLQFGTGRRRLPMPYGHKLTVVAVLKESELPKAHTCTDTIELPQCTDPVKMLNALLYALASEFAFA